VKDVLAGKDFEGFQQLSEIVQGLFFTYEFLRFDHLLESSLAAVFVDQVDIIDSLKHFYVLNDMGATDF